jgi:hypothetical protein
MQILKTQLAALKSQIVTVPFDAKKAVYGSIKVVSDDFETQMSLDGVKRI